MLKGNSFRSFEDFLNIIECYRICLEKKSYFWNNKFKKNGSIRYDDANVCLLALDNSKRAQ